MLGLTFKENCPDVRNTKVVDIVSELKEYGMDADIYDPWVDPVEAQQEYGITPVQTPKAGEYDAVILAVAHNEFRALGAQKIRAYAKPVHVLYDLKYVLSAEEADIRL